MSEDEDRTQGSGGAEAEERVARLLASAAERGPMPADVAARLDAVLEGLVADSGPPEQSGGHAAAEPPARKRLWPRLLVAAAAVSVLGLGLGNLDGLTGAQSEQAASSDAGGVTEQSEGEAAPESSDAQAPAPLNAPDDSRLQADPYPSLETAPRLTSSALAAELQRIEEFSLAVPAGDSPRQWASLCVRPATAPGDEWLPVHLDGEPGVLLLRAPSAGRRTAEIFTCEDADVPAVTTEVDAAR